MKDLARYRRRRKHASEESSEAIEAECRVLHE